MEAEDHYLFRPPPSSSSSEASSAELISQKTDVDNGRRVGGATGGKKTKQTQDESELERVTRDPGKE